MAFTVAIDGPAGAGKSTVARKAAIALGFTYIDTGAMYRTIALQVLEQGMDPEEAEAVTQVAQQSQIVLSPLDSDGNQTVFVQGRDVTKEIRTPEVSQMTSRISATPQVRTVMVELQRSISRESPHGVVLEGRDIGTVVFPNADVKVFLTASAEERAQRRYHELLEKGVEICFETVLAEQIERDQRDSQRTASPLKIAEDSHYLMTDGLSIEQVVEQIIALCCEKGYRAEGSMSS